MKNLKLSLLCVAYVARYDSVLVAPPKSGKTNLIERCRTKYYSARGGNIVFIPLERTDS